MTQNECLASAHHFTHLDVCYPGDVAWIDLSNPQNPQPTNFHVTSVAEPGTTALFAVAAIAALMFNRRPRCHSRRG